MDDAEADARVERLVSALEAVHRRLIDNGDRHWADWMDQARRDIAAGDANGLRYLLGAYGGMGSFNDVVVYARSSGGLDSEFDQLRDSIYSDAKSLLRDFDRPV